MIHGRGVERGGIVATNKGAKAGKNSPHDLVNPAILRLLRSPMHFLLSGGTLVLTVMGKKSGRQYDVPLNYVPAEDGDLVCFTGKGWSGWWRNVGSEGVPAEVTLRGSRLDATVRRIEDAAAVERGLRAFLARFPSNAKPFGVSLGNGGLPDPEDLARAARDWGTVMVKISVHQAQSQ